MTKEIIEKIRSLKLYGMLRAYQTSIETNQLSSLTADEFVKFLIESEYDDRHNKGIERRLKNAHFRYQASVENIRYDNDRDLDRNLIMRLAECNFIEKHENILISGSTGIGKSYIASAIGHQACSSGYKVMYANATKLFAKLKMTKADGSYLREIARIERNDLLVIDDFALQPLDNQNRSTLMEIIEDRHGKSSLIITSQLPVNRWHDAIGENTIADAILDRIVHNSHRIELTGESLRKERNGKLEVIN